MVYKLSVGCDLKLKIDGVCISYQKQQEWQFDLLQSAGHIWTFGGREPGSRVQIVG